MICNLRLFDGLIIFGFWGICFLKKNFVNLVYFEYLWFFIFDLYFNVLNNNENIFDVISG